MKQTLKRLTILNMDINVVVQTSDATLSSNNLSVQAMQESLLVCTHAA
jgi:hypothetical protein